MAGLSAAPKLCTVIEHELGRVARVGHADHLEFLHDEVIDLLGGFVGELFQGQREAYERTIDRINPTTEAGTRAILVFIHIPNPDAALRGVYASEPGASEPVVVRRTP